MNLFRCKSLKLSEKFVQMLSGFSVHGSKFHWIMLPVVDMRAPLQFHLNCNCGAAWDVPDQQIPGWCQCPDSWAFCRSLNEDVAVPWDTLWEALNKQYIPYVWFMISFRFIVIQRNHQWWPARVANQFSPRPTIRRRMTTMMAPPPCSPRQMSSAPVWSSRWRTSSSSDPSRRSRFASIHYINHKSLGGWKRSRHTRISV